MRYQRQDLPKIMVLGLVLIALVAYIGVSYSKLSSRYAEKAAAHEREHARAALGSQASPNAQGAPAPISAAVTALIAPVPPPERDPFAPVIAPRRPYAASATPSAKASRRTPPEPVLPPLSEGEAGGQRASARESILALTGIIVGPPYLAVLRRGEDHFIVKQGDQLPGRFRVQAITRNSVTLRDGKQEYVLRLGG